MDKLHDFELLMTYAEGKSYQLSDELIWERNQIVLGRRYMGQPGGFVSETHYHAAVSAWQKKAQQHLQEHTYQLNLDSIPGIPHFTGRKAELSRIDTVLSEEAHSKILLYGFSGMGKTSLARQYASLQHDRYDGVLFIRCDESLHASITDDHIVNIRNLTYSPEVYASDRIYFNKKWSVLTELLSRGHYLLLLDGLPHCTPSEWKKIAALPCAAILTSREISDHWQGESLEVSAFRSETEWMQFYQAFSEGDPDRLDPVHKAQLDSFRETVSGNTMIMKIALTSPEISIASILDYDEYILRSSELSKGALQTLQLLSLLPSDGMEIETFLEASGVSDALLQDLSYRSIVLIHQKELSACCSLHPFIRDIIRRRFPPTAMGCRTFLEKLAARYTVIWNRPYSEVLTALPICRSILQTWTKPEARLSDTFDAFITVLWIGGHFREAEKHVLRLFAVCGKEYGMHHQQTGRIALRVAAVYHNGMRFDEAFLWYQRAYDILRHAPKADIEYDFLLMQTADKLSRHYRHHDAFREAEDFWEKAEGFWNRYAAADSDAGICLDAAHGKAYLLHTLDRAKILYRKGQFADAEVLCRQVIGEHEVMYGTENYTHVEMTLLLSMILLSRREVKEAEKLAVYCLEAAAFYRGGHIAKETLGIKELLGDIWTADRQTDQAYDMYMEVLTVLKQYYPLQEMWASGIQEKIDKLKW